MNKIMRWFWTVFVLWMMVAKAVIAASPFDPLLGTSWSLTTPISNDVITFDTEVVANILFGKDTNGNIWGMMVNEGSYMLVRDEYIGAKKNIYGYMLDCVNASCDSLTGTYLVIFDSKGSTESYKGPYDVVSQRLTAPPPTESEYEAGKQAGKQECINNPSSCGITVSENTDGATQAGIEQCQVDPTSCGITINPNSDGATQAGIEQCRADPTSCGITINPNSDGSTQAGIEQCQVDPTSCGITINPNSDGSTQAGIEQCRLSPSSCGIEIGQIGIIEHLQAFYDFFWTNRGNLANFSGGLSVPYEYAAEWQDNNNLGYTVLLKDESDQVKAKFDIIFTPQSE